MRRFAIGIGLAVVLAGAGHAQVGSFDPEEPCGEVLRRSGDTEKLMIAAWTFGYLGASGQGLSPVDLEAAKQLLGAMFQDCIADQTLSLVALAEMQGGAPDTAVPQGAEPGSQADAEALLGRFLTPGADLAALTAALQPSPEDIAAVYGEPLAGKLTDMYAKMFTPGVQIGPKPDQDALVIHYGTTGELKGGRPILEEFPGGYQQVVQYIVSNQPIVRFKFVRAGEELGLAFDGLIFVNGHWVLMPKPWRALEE